MDIVAWLDHLDKNIFRFIQTDIHASWLDSLMLILRNPYTWIPLYAFMLYWAWRRGKWAGIKFVALTLICFAITDYTSASIIKPLVERVRPCYDPATADFVRGIIGCGGRFSFPSSHASNHFGLATFWYLSIYSLTNKKWYWLWGWAFIICFAQVYVGKHFPLDIIGGALLGILAGWSCFKIFSHWMRPTDKQIVTRPAFDLH